MDLNLSDNLKGFCFLIGGAVTLLYIHGWFMHSLYYVMLTGALIAFGYGFIVTDAIDWLKKLYRKLSSHESSNINPPANL